MSRDHWGPNTPQQLCVWERCGFDGSCGASVAARAPVLVGRLVHLRSGAYASLGSARALHRYPVQLAEVAAVAVVVVAVRPVELGRQIGGPRTSPTIAWQMTSDLPSLSSKAPSAVRISRARLSFHDRNYERGDSWDSPAAKRRWRHMCQLAGEGPVWKNRHRCNLPPGLSLFASNRSYHRIHACPAFHRPACSTTICWNHPQLHHRRCHGSSVPTISI